MTIPQHIMTFILLTMGPLTLISLYEIFQIHFWREDRIDLKKRRRYRRGE